MAADGSLLDLRPTPSLRLDDGEIPCLVLAERTVRMAVGFEACEMSVSAALPHRSVML